MHIKTVLELINKIEGFEEYSYEARILKYNAISVIVDKAKDMFPRLEIYKAATGKYRSKLKDKELQ